MRFSPGPLMPHVLGLAMRICSSRDGREVWAYAPGWIPAHALVSNMSSHLYDPIMASGDMCEASSSTLPAPSCDPNPHCHLVMVDAMALWWP